MPGETSCYDVAVLSEIHVVFGIGRLRVLRVSNAIPIELVLHYCDKSLVCSGCQSSVGKVNQRKSLAQSQKTIQ